MPFGGKPHYLFKFTRRIRGQFQNGLDHWNFKNDSNYSACLLNTTSLACAVEQSYAE